jgi:hypothetical protein
MSNAEAEIDRNKNISEWLKTRTPQDLLGIVQGLFICAQQGTDVLVSVHVNAKTGERESCNLEVDDFHLVALELHDRVTTLQEEVETLNNHILELGERD